MEIPVSFDFLCECIQRGNRKDFLSSLFQKKIRVLEICTTSMPYKKNNGSEDGAEIIQWNKDLELNPSFDIVWFHGAVEHSSIKTIFSDILARVGPTFILLCDYWNIPSVRSGILTSILHHKLNIENSIPLRTTFDNSYYYSEEEASWDNGIFISVLKK